MMGKFCTRLPSPKTPAKIKTASLIAQMRQMIKIFSLLMPCFSTNAFCVPLTKFKAMSNSLGGGVLCAICKIKAAFGG